MEIHWIAMKRTLIAFYYTQWDLENHLSHLKPLVERLDAECAVIAQGIYLAQTDAQAELVDTARHHLRTHNIHSAILTVDPSYEAKGQNQPMQIVGIDDQL